MYKRFEKDKAIKLRKEGNSYAVISSILKIAKSTLSDWLAGVEFIPNEMIVKNIADNNKRLVSLKRVDKMISLNVANNYAINTVGQTTKRDNYIFGLGIYLGEGSKSGIRISNSDPRIIKFALNWFKDHFGLTDSNFRIRIHIYPDSNKKEINEYWSMSLNLDKKYFFEPHVDIRTNKNKARQGILPYGTAHLSVVSNGNKDFGILLHRKIIASIDQVLK